MSLHCGKHRKQFVFIWALIAFACAEFIVPIFMIAATFASFLRDRCREQTIGADGSESEKHQVPGIPTSIRVWFFLLNWPDNWYSLCVERLCGIFMFMYHLFFYPIIRDKNLLLASIQCNQEFVTLIFGALVVSGAQDLLAEDTVNFMFGVFVIMCIRFGYKSLQAQK